MNEPSIYKPEFIPFYIGIKKRYNLTDTQTLIYGFVRFYLANGGEFYFSNKGIAEAIGKEELSVQAISVAIKALIGKNLLEATYKIKASGGKIRFLRLKAEFNSDLKYTLTQSSSTLEENKNKIKENKINNISANKKNKKYGRDWLRTEEAKKELIQYATSKSSFVKPKAVLIEFETMNNWLDSTGKRYKNYKAFAKNWILKWIKQNYQQWQNQYARRQELEHYKRKEAERRQYSADGDPVALNQLLKRMYEEDKAKQDKA